MAYERLISVMGENNIPLNQFNHFDYVDALQQLSEIELYNHPRKRKLVQEFASKCLQKLEEEENAEKNKVKVSNFLARSRQYQTMRQERLEAMRFLDEKYDEKNKQLKFYPKTNKRMATQKDRTWKDIDGYDNIPVESKIQIPNSSVIEAQEYMTFKSKMI